MSHALEHADTGQDFDQKFQSMFVGQIVLSIEIDGRVRCPVVTIVFANGAEIRLTLKDRDDSMMMREPELVQ